MPLKLHNFGEPASIPKQSYFCQKLETAFRAAGYSDYTTVAALPTSGPKSKLPYVTFTSGEKMGDSHFIIQHMVQTGQMKDLNAHLTDAQKADARAWQGYIEEVVFPANVVTRYGDDTNWATFCKEALGSIPYLVRGGLAYMVRRGALNQLYQRGTARYSKAELAQILEDAIRNAEAKLEASVEQGGQAYVLGGSAASTADVALYSWLVCVLCTKCNPVQAEGILASPTLRRYVAGLTEKWFPEYEKILALVK